MVIFFNLNMKKASFFFYKNGIKTVCCSAKRRVSMDVFDLEVEN
jgi:hypothetical protein